jgi:tetratricopeptide (TPR) repeat protein
MRAEYADFLQAQGRRDEAERAYRSAPAEQPGLAVAWFNLGTLLAEAGRRSESSNAFQEAVHLDPTGSPIGGGLYRARVLGRAAPGRPLQPQILSFGVVRQRVE